MTRLIMPVGHNINAAFYAVQKNDFLITAHFAWRKTRIEIYKSVSKKAKNQAEKAHLCLATKL